MNTTTERFKARLEALLIEADVAVVLQPAGLAFVSTDWSIYLPVVDLVYQKPGSRSDRP